LLNENASATSQVLESVVALSTMNDSTLYVGQAPESTVVDDNSSAVSTTLANELVDESNPVVAEALYDDVSNVESSAPIIAIADYSDSTVGAESSETRHSSGNSSSKEEAGGGTIPTEDCSPDEALYCRTASLPSTDVVVRDETICSGNNEESKVGGTPCHDDSIVLPDEVHNQRPAAMTESCIVAGSDLSDTATSAGKTNMLLIVGSSTVVTGTVDPAPFSPEGPPESVTLEHEHAKSHREVTKRADEVNSIIFHDPMAVDDSGNAEPVVTISNDTRATEGTNHGSCDDYW
jgi:hypothetical protein